jgi:hypothetical protein
MMNDKTGELQTDELGLSVWNREELHGGEASWTLSLSPKLIESLARQVNLDVHTTSGILNDHMFYFLSDSVRLAVKRFLE